MKRKIKKVLVSCVLSVLCGSICGKLLYGVYDKRIEADIYGEKIYLIQAGSYDNYDNMVKNTSFSHYVYYKDEDGLFKSIIGLTENKDNINKLKSIYNGDVSVLEYYSNDLELNKKIKEFDNKLVHITNGEEIKNLTLSMLDLYKDKNATLKQITS